MRKACKLPSEWLRLLCKKWADKNEDLVDSTDTKFMDYKPYLNGMLSSQLLCRLSIPSLSLPSAMKEMGLGDTTCSTQLDFWRILGVEDEFDKAYIIAQIERFCSLYNIRNFVLDEDPLFGGEYAGTDPGPLGDPSPYLDHPTASDATALPDLARLGSSKKTSGGDGGKAQRIAKETEKAMEMERRSSMKREQRRAVQERKEQKAREREAHAVRKAQERTAREATRQERKRKREELRREREIQVKEQKEAALRRAADLVASNRVPIEITRGAAAAAKVVAASTMTPPSAGQGIQIKQEDEQPQQRTYQRDTRVCILLWPSTVRVVVFSYIPRGFVFCAIQTTRKRKRDPPLSSRPRLIYTRYEE